MNPVEVNSSRKSPFSKSMRSFVKTGFDSQNNLLPTFFHYELNQRQRSERRGTRFEEPSR
ncbi:hypothetical protein LEP1GSC060_3812 [Leptospira weilii serovar Ranarum str. ICFT]|uniref:Uncharacterized protein n=1 Tax=Leptospira weilii serovar Ranarum str. ICFT TaxID=1218598 RepID=N1WNC1_9LEPT|nr:hypothetical protein LEP1GSC060_3812 [Leptospira weilii serovar Ranarum str. ICFT]